MLTLTKLPEIERLPVAAAAGGRDWAESAADEPLVEQHFGGLTEYFARGKEEPLAQRAAECIGHHPWLATGAAIAAGALIGTLARLRGRRAGDNLSSAAASPAGGS